MTKQTKNTRSLLSCNHSWVLLSHFQEIMWKLCNIFLDILLYSLINLNRLTLKDIINISKIWVQIFDIFPDILLHSSSALLLICAHSGDLPIRIIHFIMKLTLIRVINGLQSLHIFKFILKELIFMFLRNTISHRRRNKRLDVEVVFLTIFHFLIFRPDMLSLSLILIKHWNFGMNPILKSFIWVHKHINFIIILVLKPPLPARWWLFRWSHLRSRRALKPRDHNRLVATCRVALITCIPTIFWWF